MTLTIRTGLVWSAILVVAGLMVELATTWSTRPLAFVVFVAVAGPLVVGGMLLFLWTLVTAEREGPDTL